MALSFSFPILCSWSGLSEILKWKVYRNESKNGIASLWLCWLFCHNIIIIIPFWTHSLLSFSVYFIFIRILCIFWSLYFVLSNILSLSLSWGKRREGEKLDRNFKKPKSKTIRKTLVFCFVKWPESEKTSGGCRSRSRRRRRHF